MTIKIILCALLFFSKSTSAKIGGGDNIDYAPLPHEFCNNVSNQKQRNLLNRYPKDEGIIKIYAYYLGLCQLVADGNISEHAASIFWTEQRDALLKERKSIEK